ncbi:cytochrome P450 2D15-like [Physella acuta]|uniref:cytochrome P450 2D15-like n=1 Tax=Physella acuta TaxID=109671 RepID=UPI0027DCB17C|nr:cytochrome P450 2D15-like [Physella acuta]
MEVTSLLALAVVVTTIFYWLMRKPNNLPPSPGIALPIVGHLYLMERDPRQQFKKWSQKLGAIFSLKLGQETVVVLNSFEVIKEALVKHGDSLSDRSTRSFMARNVPHITNGILLASGSDWKEQRTTSLSILRKFGLGKNILSETIAEEIRILLKNLANENGKPIRIRGLLNISVCNIISSIIFGRRFDYDDPKHNHLTELLNDLVRLNSGVIQLNFLPFLKYLPKYRTTGQQLVSIATEIREFSKSIVEEIRKSYDPNNLDNYIVAYVHEMEKKRQLNQPTYLNEISLVRHIDNLFLAGTETTSTTILWALYFVLLHPETQNKIYQEIKEYVGLGRAPTMSDKPQLKYLNAFIMETLRFSSTIPFSVTHVCSQDTVLNGFTIPKDAQVIPNLYAVLHDEIIWGDPENFRPERFLDEQGNLIKREELIPFSIGRRICLGESLAKMELFLFLSSMFERFEFLSDKPNQSISKIEIFGGVVSLAPFDIKCVKRLQ